MLQRKVEAVQILVCAAEIEKRPGGNHNKVIRCSAHGKPKTREKVRSLEAESHTNFGGSGGTEAAAVLSIRTPSKTLLNVDL